MYAQAIEDTGLSYESLRNIVSVCTRVELSRRRDNLTFSHHEAVARLSPPEQSRWLDKAAEQGLTSKGPRAAVRAAAQGGPSLLQPGDGGRVLPLETLWPTSQSLLQTTAGHYLQLVEEHLRRLRRNQCRHPRLLAGALPTTSKR